MTQIIEAMNGGEVQVGLDESFEVRLPENPTTGYGWRLDSSGAPAVEVQEDDFEPPKASLGAGGVRRWRFRAVQEGVADLRLEYRREWEQRAARTFTVTVRVKRR
jgi:inhibitor of cysteine peptidase